MGEVDIQLRPKLGKPPKRYTHPSPNQALGTVRPRQRRVRGHSRTSCSWLLRAQWNKIKTSSLGYPQHFRLDSAQFSTMVRDLVIDKLVDHVV